MAWASGKVRTRGLLYNWTIVFAGNFVGAFATAILAFCSTQYTFGSGAVGLAALTTAHAKTSLAFIPALALGVMCNALVCLGVWMCYGARTSADKIFTIVLPIAAFVAAGFEHSIANIYFISIGFFIKTGDPASFLDGNRKNSNGLSESELEQLSDRQFAAGHDRQRDRRIGYGWRGLLVCLFAKEAAKRITIAGASDLTPRPETWLYCCNSR